MDRADKDGDKQITIRRDKTMRKNFGAKPFLYPQPVMILGTYDENGKANAMNAAWGGIVGANEIIVDLSAYFRHKKNTPR